MQKFKEISIIKFVFSKNFIYSVVVEQVFGRLKIDFNF